MSTDKKQPVFSLRDHFLEANVWQNESDKGPFYSSEVHKTYKDGDEYKISHSFSGHEPIIAGVLLIQAGLEKLKLEAADYAAQRNGQAPAPAR